MIIKSLRGKILLYFTLLTIFIFTLFGIFLYIGFKKIIISKVDEILVDKVKYISTFVRIEEGKISFDISKKDIGEFSFILRLNTGEIVYAYPSSFKVPLSAKGLSTLNVNGKTMRIITYSFLKEDEFFKDLKFLIPSKKYGFILQVGKDLKSETDIIKISISKAENFNVFRS